MLRVFAQNIGTSTDNVATYRVRVYSNYRLIYRGTIEGHKRDDGWEELLRTIADQSVKEKGLALLR